MRIATAIETYRDHQIVLDGTSFVTFVVSKDFKKKLSKGLKL